MGSFLKFILDQEKKNEKEKKKKKKAREAALTATRPEPTIDTVGRTSYFDRAIAGDGAGVLYADSSISEQNESPEQLRKKREQENIKRRKEAIQRQIQNLKDRKETIQDRIDNLIKRKSTIG